MRNVAPLPTLLIEALSGERVQVDLQTVLALLAALGGVVLYSRHDLQFSPLGLAWMMLNMVAAVVEHGQNGFLGGAIAGQHGLLRLHPKA